MGTSDIHGYFPAVPDPPIEPLQFRVVPDHETLGHVPEGFIQLEDQMKRAYLVPAFMVESLEAAARQNRARQSVVDATVEVCSSIHIVIKYSQTHGHQEPGKPPRDTRKLNGYVPFPPYRVRLVVFYTQCIIIHSSFRDRARMKPRRCMKTSVVSWTAMVFHSRSPRGSFSAIKCSLSISTKIRMK